jgi:hypothetical protein
MQKKNVLVDVEDNTGVWVNIVEIKCVVPNWIQIAVDDSGFVLLSRTSNNNVWI